MIVMLVCTGTRKVRYSDRDMMPYTAAVMTELLRVTLVASLTIEHQAMHDVIVCGVKIPKGNSFLACSLINTGWITVISGNVLHIV